MNNQKQKYKAFLFAVFLVISIKAVSQIPRFSTVPNLQPGDSVSIIHLIKNGTEARKRKVIGWFPKDSLSREQMDKILDSLNTGVEAAEKLIKAPLAWQVQQK